MSKVLGGVWCVMAVYSVTVTLMIFGVLFLNPTPSLPRGLYIRTWEPIGYGSIIVFPVPDAIRSIVKSDVVALMKPVVALPGDKICMIDRVYSINELPFATLTDKMPPAKWSGCHVLEIGEIGVGSTLVDTSVDSRLYGAVKTEDAFVVRPLLTEEIYR